MSVQLIKPTKEAMENPEVAFQVVMRLYESALAAQTAAGKTSIVDLGARTDHPGAPPLGVVYLYTIAGALYARTATAPTLLAA